jgi:Mrp family chromosome partitioning ATPase
VSPAFDTLLARCKETYDLILLAAPSLLDTDTAVVASKIDATCLVLTSGISRLATVIETKARLQAMKAQMFGVILMARR